MSTYDGDPTTYPITATLPDDGDNYDAASVNVPLSTALDRTAWLSTRRLREVTSGAALQALTGTARQNGDIALIVESGMPTGRYVYSATSTLVPGYGEGVIVPTDGVGRWISDMYSTHGMDDQLSGFALILGATEQLARPDVVPYRTLTLQRKGFSADPPDTLFALGSTLSATWSAMLIGAQPMTLDLPDLDNGDLVEVQAVVNADSATADGYLALAYEDDSVIIRLDGAIINVPAAAAEVRCYSLCGVHTSAGGTGVKVHLQGRVSTMVGTPRLSIYNGVSLVAKVIRP
jgi:hypothetical protein